MHTFVSHKYSKQVQKIFRIKINVLKCQTAQPQELLHPMCEWREIKYPSVIKYYPVKNPAFLCLCRCHKKPSIARKVLYHLGFMKMILLLLLNCRNKPLETGRHFIRNACVKPLCKLFLCNVACESWCKNKSQSRIEVFCSQLHTCINQY